MWCLHCFDPRSWVRFFGGLACVLRVLKGAHCRRFIQAVCYNLVTVTVLRVAYCVFRYETVGSLVHATRNTQL